MVASIAIEGPRTGDGMLGRAYRRNADAKQMQGGATIQAVIREYSGKGVRELFDMLESKKADVENLLRTIKGLVSYTLARSAHGGFSVTVCQDQAGIDESTQKAKDWVAKNAGHVAANPPRMSSATVITHLK